MLSTVRRSHCLIAVLAAAFTFGCISAPAAPAQGTPAQASAAAPAGSSASLETAAGRAGDTARKVAFSLIGLALAGAGVVLCFKRDFKEAVGVLAIGVIAVLLASPTGVGVLQNTVTLLFG